MFGAILGAAAGIFGASKSAKASKSAANTQLQASREQTELYRDIHDQTRADLNPFREAGTNALQAYASELGLGARPEGFDGLSMSAAAKFGLNEGRDAIESGAARRGGLYSGATLKALENHRSNIATMDRDNQLNRLAGLISGGQASAGQQAAAGNAYASNAGSAIAGGANAAAAGQIGSANAINSGINNALSLFAYNKQLNPQQQGGFNPFAF